MSSSRWNRLMIGTPATIAMVVSVLLVLKIGDAGPVVVHALMSVGALWGMWNGLKRGVVYGARGAKYDRSRDEKAFRREMLAALGIILVGQAMFVAFALTEGSQ